MSSLLTVLQRASLKQLTHAPLTGGAHVSVDCGGGDRLVPEQITNVPDGRSAFEQLGRVTVPEHMRMEMSAEPLPDPSHDPRHHLVGDPLAGRPGGRYVNIPLGCSGNSARRFGAVGANERHGRIEATLRSAAACGER